MKDLVKGIKKNRHELIIKDIIEYECYDVKAYLGYENGLGKKFKKDGRLLYFITDDTYFCIVIRNIIHSGFFNDFTIDDVVSVINKYYNQGKFKVIL